MVYRYCDKLFLYGTLRSAFDNPFSRRLREETRLLGTAYVKGKLYEIDGYPGGVYDPDSDEKIYGELYFLNASERLLKWLDDYELASRESLRENEYTRSIIPVYQDQFESKAWMYLYNRPVNEANRIPGGDYIQFIESRENDQPD